ncbi:MAG TPA: tetratricopeptide repeat protein, partial [Candidatus Hydrogenedentes bacterium]|nr:tetratricopeptide repeat protein [Candidatus Hydrogenedentota bacterium]
MPKPVIFAILLSLVAGAAVGSAPLSPELAHLEALSGNPALLLKMVRGFDRLQCELANWDMELAEELALSGDTELAEEKMEQARKRLALVEEAYTYVLERYPDNGRALTYYGELIYDYQGDHTKALMLWKKAAALNPELGDVFNNLGIHYSHAGDLSRGLDYFDKALKCEPNNPDYLYNLCQTYLTQFPAVAKRKGWSLKKVYSTAMKMSKKAAELGDDYELVQDYAVNFFAAENFQVKADWRQ